MFGFHRDVRVTQKRLKKKKKRHILYEQYRTAQKSVCVVGVPSNPEAVLLACKA